MTTPLKVIARDSALSQIQVKEVMEQLPDIHYENMAVSSLGDQDQTSSLRDELPADFFTREIDNAVLNGTADVAIHSAKDLPFPLHKDLRVIALTRCLDPNDALVTKNNVSLENLPAGACIATSSMLREKALLKLRDDLTFKDIRGTIHERIAQVDEGFADGVVVATCALKRLGLENRMATHLSIGTYPLQGNLAIVAHKHRHDVAEIFAKLDVRSYFGKVYLVGFGPGDPELMTIKADKVLQEADVIFYDDLIDETVLDRYDAKTVYVGKRKGFTCKTQDEINHLLKESALQGKMVVRLKGGDPGIFGRVGEEAEFLTRWMISFDIIPGVTSAMAAAASQHISLTYRGLSQTFSFLTAHHAEHRSVQVPNVDTIVYYMGASQLNILSKRLQEEGRSSDEGVLLVENASLSQERSEVRSIATMADTQLQSPLMVIVGAVAKKAWSNARVLYTGLNARNYQTYKKVVHYPLIKTVFHQSSLPSNYDALLFTSQEAVTYFAQHHSLLDIPIIAIGERTKHRIKMYGGTVAHMPDIPESPYVLDLIETLPYQKYLYPCSSRSANVLHKSEKVDPVVIYETKFLKPNRVDLSEFDEVVFTSPSTVDAFLEIYSDIPQELLCVVLGGVTAKHLKQRQANVSIQMKRSHKEAS